MKVSHTWAENGSGIGTLMTLRGKQRTPNNEDRLLTIKGMQFFF